MTAAERQARTEAADRLCRQAYAAAAGPPVGACLVAVGGYGRGELAPYSDLDVVLVQQPGVGPQAERLWYPLWDSGAKLDHAVRSFDEMLEAAASDLRVALGLLDLRHLAGDPELSFRLRAELLTRWRREARRQLPELHDLVRSRHRLFGELAHAAVPNLKESAGGLRDATVLRALVASWLVDVPHAELELCRRELLDLRDLLQRWAGRGVDRVGPEGWAALAEGRSEPAAQRRVRELGRRLAHLSRVSWRRADAVLARPRGGRRAPELERIAPGIAVSAGEVVLDGRVRPETDPVLLIRAAAEASERDLVLAPPTAARLVREGAPLPEPWPAAARQAWTRLLAGPGLIGVWETLEETGALDRLLPEWARIRLLPHASAVHRFTVDRHVIETCAEAARLIRDVARPDLLLTAAVLHDIGKGGTTEHCSAGEPLARRIAARMGFAPAEVELIGTLVRRHLLLAEVATTRDLEDPATIAAVRDRLGSAETVRLLLALTEADARATGPAAWSAWRAGLIRRLAERVLACWDTGPPTAPVRRPPEPVGLREPGVPEFVVRPGPGGTRVTVAAEDRVGLLADLAGVFAVQRAAVQSARAWTRGDTAISEWELETDHLDPAILRQSLAAVVAGRVDVARRLRRQVDQQPPVVRLAHGASARATVLEVRTQDRLGVVYRVCAALAATGVSVVSAHIDTVGPQAVDVFYLQEPEAGPLDPVRADAAVAAVRTALDRAEGSVRVGSPG